MSAIHTGPSLRRLPWPARYTSALCSFCLLTGLGFSGFAHRARTPPETLVKLYVPLHSENCKWSDKIVEKDSGNYSLWAKSGRSLFFSNKVLLELSHVQLIRYC